LGSLLVRVGWVALQPVNNSGLGGSDRHPVPKRTLQAAEEVLAPGQRLLVKVIQSLELELVGEFTHQRAVVPACPPQGDVGLAGDALPEVEDAKFLEDLLHNDVAHQLDPLVLGLLEWGERWEDLHERIHRQPVALLHLAQTELDIVAKEQSVPADGIFQRKCLGFEFDFEVAEHVRADVHLCSLLHVGMAELEDDFGVPTGNPSSYGMRRRRMKALL